jgi:hypothetical protein
MSIQNDIKDSALFNDNLDKTLSRDVFNDYAGMISEFLSCVIDNVNIQDTTHFLFIVNRGLNTLKHCFKLIYLYTKNHVIAIHHCRRGFYYYIEFMGQICEDGNSYLQLNSKDAVLFVYKKTIYDIEQDHIREHPLCAKDKDALSLIGVSIDIFNTIVTSMLQLTIHSVDNRDETIKRIIDKSFKICSKLNQDINESKTVLSFVSTINKFVTCGDKYGELCNGFIKKYNKKHIDNELLCKKLQSLVCKTKLKELTTLRFINWVYSS